MHIQKRLRTNEGFDVLLFYWMKGFGSSLEFMICKTLFFFFKAFLIFLFQSQKRFAGHVAKLPCLKGIKSPKMFKNLETVPAIKVFMGHWSSKGSLKEPAELSVSPPHLHRNMHLLVLEASRGNCKNKIQTTQLTNKIFGWACVYKVS